MPRPRSAMRKIRDVLRLRLGEGLSQRRVAAAAGLPYTTVARYVALAKRVGLSWPLPTDMDDRDLESQLFKRPAPVPSQLRPLPNWSELHRELRRPGVTLQLLWMEYKERSPQGYQYTQFCHHYRAWAGRLDLVLRQDHRAGEKMFVDFAGQTLGIVDPQTGEITQAQLFVAVLGASSYTYAEAVGTQGMPDWIAAHVHAFAYFGGAPEIVVCDNLKSGVVSPHRYEPHLNPSYQEMAAHYACAVVPGRPYKPRDKAKAEVGVQVAQRWVLAGLRNHRFFSLAEANQAIRAKLLWLNQRPFQKLEGSRQSLFEQLERPALRTLPARPYEYATWKQAKVSIDYHLEVERHYYSVPYQLVGQRCDVRLTRDTLEVLLRGRRVALHVRSYRAGSHTTMAEHMPASHRRHLEWTPSRIVNWAKESGPGTAGLVEAIMQARPHPEQGFRSCLGIMRLGRRYSPERLEAACLRALTLQAYSSRSVESMLRTGLDQQPLVAAPAAPVLEHENLRGSTYYQ